MFQKINMKLFLKSILITFIFFIIGFLAFKNTVNAEGDCKVKKAYFEPSGKQPNGWYNDKEKPTIKIKIETENCSGKKIEMSITEEDWALDPDDDIKGFDNIKYPIEKSEILEISIKPGEDECEPIGDPSNDCEWYIRVFKTDGGANVDYSNKNKPEYRLYFDCDGWCDEEAEFVNINYGNPKIEWFFFKKVETDVNGNIKPGTEQDQSQAYDSLVLCKQARLSYIETNGKDPKTVGNCFYKLIWTPSPPPTIDVTATQGIAYEREYKLLAPIPGLIPGNVVKDDFRLGDFINRLLKIILGLCVALSVIMIVIGGIQWMLTDSFISKNEGKERIKNALLGLGLALGSYILLSTINPNLLNLNFGLEKQEIVINPDFIETDKPHQSENGKFCSGMFTENSKWTPPSDDTIRTQLRNLNISINKNNCSEVGESNCTSVKDLNLDYVKKLKELCPSCQITITGGTECWLHSKKTLHLPGNPTIDVKKTPEILKILKEKGKIIELKNWGTAYEINGIWYVDESDHIHIQKPRK